jgi:hypothetical protein
MEITMKKNIPLLIVSANLIILVLLTLFVPELMISPGKSIDAHAEISSDCFACHTAFIGSPSEKCIVCHKVEEIGLKTTKGLTIDKENKNVAFHQNLIEEDCTSCHSDHKGVKAFRPISQFSHELLDPVLQENCEGCHQNPEDRLHKQITGNCKQCHSQDSWTPATFDHDEYFRFDRHHDTECETCHMQNDYSNYTCYGCHEHSRSKIREEHYEEGIRDYENCAECHRSGDEHEAKRIWRSKRSGNYNPDSINSKYYKYMKEDHEDDD